MQNTKPLSITVVFLAIASLLPFSLSARDITMLTTEWAPHYGSDLPENGLTTALVMAAFKAVGHNAEIKFIPWTRALKDVKEGKADIVMGAYHSADREADYLFSDAIVHLDTGLIARPGLGKNTFSSLRDLQGYSIGVARGWANNDEFDAANYLEKHVSTSPSLNIKKLFRGRIDMAVMNFDLFRYEAKKAGFCLADIEFIDPPLETHGLHIMASKQITDYREIITDFNNGLDKIRKNGKFQRILNRFRN